MDGTGYYVSLAYITLLLLLVLCLYMTLLYSAYHLPTHHNHLKQLSIITSTDVSLTVWILIIITISVTIDTPLLKTSDSCKIFSQVTTFLVGFCIWMKTFSCVCGAYLYRTWRIWFKIASCLFLSTVVSIIALAPSFTNSQNFSNDNYIIHPPEGGTGNINESIATTTTTVTSSIIHDINVGNYSKVDIDISTTYTPQFDTITVINRTDITETAVPMTTNDSLIEKKPINADNELSNNVTSAFTCILPQTHGPTQGVVLIFFNVILPLLVISYLHYSSTNNLQTMLVTRTIERDIYNNTKRVRWSITASIISCMFAPIIAVIVENVVGDIGTYIVTCAVILAILVTIVPVGIMLTSPHMRPALKCCKASIIIEKLQTIRSVRRIEEERRVGSIDGPSFRIHSAENPKEQHMRSRVPMGFSDFAKNDPDFLKRIANELAFPKTGGKASKSDPKIKVSTSCFTNEAMEVEINEEVECSTHTTGIPPPRLSNQREWLTAGENNKESNNLPGALVIVNANTDLMNAASLDMSHSMLTFKDPGSCSCATSKQTTQRDTVKYIYNSTDESTIHMPDITITLQSENNQNTSNLIKKQNSQNSRFLLCPEYSMFSHCSSKDLKSLNYITESDDNISFKSCDSGISSIENGSRKGSLCIYTQEQFI